MAYEQFASLYDRLMDDMPYEAWLRFASQCWDKYGLPQRVVDLGCGTGSIAIPLAAQGLEVYGLDLSERMLEVARQKTEEAAAAGELNRGGSLTWLRQDMREWKLDRLADAVVSFCDCLNYLLEEADVTLTFKQVYAGLRPGGIFVFDVHAPQQLLSYAEEQPFFMNEPDVSYIWTSEFDAERCQIEHALTIFAREPEASASEGDGAKREALYRRIDELHVQRAYAPEWLQRELKRAGFRETAVYADFLWKSPAEDTERLFFVAVK